MLGHAVRFLGAAAPWVKPAKRQAAEIGIATIVAKLQSSGVMRYHGFVIGVWGFPQASPEQQHRQHACYLASSTGVCTAGDPQGADP
jgi:hypothetical protein